MSDQDGNPEDRFSGNEVYSYLITFNKSITPCLTSLSSSGLPVK